MGIKFLQGFLLLAAVVKALPASTTLTADSSSVTTIFNPFVGSEGAIDFNGTKVDFSSAASTEAKGQISKTTNWAGAIVRKPPSGTFTHATGTFVVPKVSRPANEKKEYGMASWVGIGDHDIIQTGITSTISADGSHHNTGWCEYFPARKSCSTLNHTHNC